MAYLILSREFSSFNSMALNILSGIPETNSQLRSINSVENPSPQDRVRIKAELAQLVAYKTSLVVKELAVFIEAYKFEFGLTHIPQLQHTINLLSTIPAQDIQLQKLIQHIKDICEKLLAPQSSAPPSFPFPLPKALMDLVFEFSGHNYLKDAYTPLGGNLCFPDKNHARHYAIAMQAHFQQKNFVQSLLRLLILHHPVKTQWQFFLELTHNPLLIEIIKQFYESEACRLAVRELYIPPFCNLMLFQNSPAQALFDGKERAYIPFEKDREIVNIPFFKNIRSTQLEVNQFTAALGRIDILLRDQRFYEFNLFVEIDYSGFKDLFQRIQNPCLQVLTLDIHLIPGNLTILSNLEGILPYIAQAFPNLIVLRFKPMANSIRIVPLNFWQNFKKLEVFLGWKGIPLPSSLTPNLKYIGNDETEASKVCDLLRLDGNKPCEYRKA